MALMPALMDEMDNTEKATPLNPIVIAVISQTPPDTWRMTITSDPGLGPFDSIVELENDMAWEKEITNRRLLEFRQE